MTVMQEQGNELIRPAVTDMAADETAAAPEQRTFDEKLAKLEETLNREALYRLLAYCAEERTLDDVERTMETWPAYKSATQNQYRLAEHLVRAGGLAKLERDANGALIAQEDKAGLDEDAVDDLVHAVSYRTTDVGARFVEQHRPQARLVELLQLAPERADVYRELLEFTAKKPRTYGDIAELLRDRPVLETVIAGVRHTMQPSVFVDKLERSGALVWNEGWRLTEEGEAFLQDLKASE